MLLENKKQQKGQCDEGKKDRVGANFD